jgi:hypothetical protein
MEAAQSQFGHLGFLLGNNQPRLFTLFFVGQKHGKLDQKNSLPKIQFIIEAICDIHIK